MGGDQDPGTLEDDQVAKKLLKSLTAKADANMVQIRVDSGSSLDRCAAHSIRNAVRWTSKTPPV